jgi:methylenetetrahydrofolate reductase (NADPH)
MEIKGFRSDVKLVDFLDDYPFTVSAEVIPPRNGSEQMKILYQVQQLIQAGAQFLSVTKGAGGSLRGGSLPIAQSIKEQFGVPAIAHFTCRDLTAQDVENQLIDHHYFGIRNILALRGDPPDNNGQPTQWKAKEGGYDYAYQLIEQIRKLNQGIYLSRPGGPPPDSSVPGVSDRTDFCIGAAAYPEHPVEEERIRFFKLKVDAGAEFGMTDMCFDPEIYARFIDLCAKSGIKIPILPGTRVLKTRDQAQRMAAKFRVSVPKDVLAVLPENAEALGTEGSKRGVELFLKFAERMKAYGAPGIHLYVISDATTASTAMKELRNLE